MFAACGVVVMGGFYALGQANIERREYRQEKLQQVLTPRGTHRE